MALRIPNTNVPSTRVQWLSVSPEMLVALMKSLREPRTFSSNDLPEDAELVRCAVDQWTGNIMLLISSDEFPEHRAGTQIQEFSVRFTEHHESVALHR